MTKIYECDRCFKQLYTDTGDSVYTVPFDSSQIELCQRCFDEYRAVTAPHQAQIRDWFYNSTEYTEIEEEGD